MVLKPCFSQINSSFNMYVNKAVHRQNSAPNLHHTITGMVILKGS